MNQKDNAMRNFKSTVKASLVAAGITLTAPVPASAYAIDCAILLCLAGGFPASTECTAAKLELIRRITPWPIEPPLQLWNCPMSMSGFPPLPNLGRDGLTPDVRRFRDGIEVYNVNYQSYRTSDGMEVTDSTTRGIYDDEGTFAWRGASLQEAPEWLQEAAGYRGNGMTLKKRSIILRTTDYQDNMHIEVIDY